MSLDAVLARGRQRMRQRMVDTYEIRVRNGGIEYDDFLQTEVESTDLLFTTPGYIPSSAGFDLSRAGDVGGRRSLTSQRIVRIPWDADEVPADAIAVCVAAGPSTPPRMLNKQYRVGGSSGSSQGTATDLEILEVLS